MRNTVHKQHNAPTKWIIVYNAISIEYRICKQINSTDNYILDASKMFIHINIDIQYMRCQFVTISDLEKMIETIYYWPQVKEIYIYK